MRQAKIKITFLIICLCLSVLAYSLNSHQRANSAQAELQAAYTQKLFYDLKGKRVAFAPYLKQKKWVVVMIWANDCHVCNQEIGQYKALHQRLQAKTAIVVGISIDGWKNKHKALGFIQRHKVNFDNLLIEPKEVPSFFNPIAGSDFVGTPTFIIYDRDGNYKGKQAGAVPANIIEKYIKDNDK